jgi:hypothetical protein
MAIKQNFYETLSKKNNVLGSYSKLDFLHNKTNIYAAEDKLTLKNTINISLFPSYLEPTFKDENEFEIIKIPQNKITGYAVLIKNNPDIDTLFKTEFKKSFRANILRFVNRFEDCFNARYKMFFEHITEDEYNFLMEELHKMLITRFNQRNDSNKVLKNWDDYVNDTYKLIKSKKASLFVIYHNETPVHICLNHHFNNIIFVSVPSYDIDFAKFALGNVSLYKILEWSIDHKYEVMDMAYGYLEYKRRWSNLIYDFEHHIIYPKNNLLAKILATIEVKKLNLKNSLKRKNIDERIEKIKKTLKKQPSTENDTSYKIENTEINNLSSLETILENSEIFNTLRKPINDFLYTNKEHIDNLTVFEKTHKKEYVLKGKSITQKLTLN